MIQRHATQTILDALSDNPVVFVHGARQVGKSTLAQALGDTTWPARYLTLDDITVLAAAKSDPAGFLAGFGEPVILDEVQRAPELFAAIKAEVDRARRPGRFLLTGSANVLLLPELAQYLVGRMELVVLWPFSQGEIESHRENFIDVAFSVDPFSPCVVTEGWSESAERMVRGGFPEAFLRESAPRRSAWFGSYLATILQRDVRDLANIEGLTDLPRLLSLLAARSASLVNLAEIARSAAMPQSTVKRYFSLLKAIFLVQELPAWSSNLGKRLVRAPRLLLCDTGLIAHLNGLDVQRLESDRTLGGALLEAFVAMELMKQVGWSRSKPRIYHFRFQTGQEVDIVLEDPAGRLVGIEVKASSSIGASDIKGLRSFAEVTGDRFVRGIVLYTGQEQVPFARNIHALPLPSLWQEHSLPLTPCCSSS
jgi:predicted AAA+ superfamily ATPase